MIRAHRFRVDKLGREKVMLNDNAADFPKNSPVDLISVQIDAKVTEILARDADLVSAYGDRQQAREIKGDARDDLIGKFGDIVMGAVAIGDVAVPGITAKYKMPEPRTEQKLIATADAWHADTAPPLEALFTGVGLEEDFRADLLASKTAFQQADDSADSATEHYGEAVGALNHLVRETMALARQRSALVKLKYKNNPGKLAAWEIASHLEKAPKPATKPAKEPKPE